MLERLSNDTILKEYNMKCLTRYNARFKVSNEDLAQHSFFVAVFCLRIASQLGARADVSKEKLVTFALLHDMPELLMGDFPHTLKVQYPNVAELLYGVECDYYKDNWSEYANLYETLTPLEKEIITLADTYSVCQYTLYEKLLGNCSKEVDDIYINSNIRIDTSINKINNLIGGIN